MKQMMFAVLLFLPGISFGFAGLFSQNQCGYSQNNFPTEQRDYEHSNTVRIRNYEGARSQAEERMPQLNEQIGRTRNSLRYYFPREWSDAMITHMENGLDCCSSSRSVASTSNIFNRNPAGSDAETYPAPTYEVVDPTAGGYEEAPPAQDYGDADLSCNGYSKDYCKSDWGNNDSPSNGGLCLQTGFAASPAWFGAACRGGGRVNPEVCGNSRISRHPQDYQQCVQVLDYYYRLSLEKRRLASEIQAYNDDINGLRNPNRGRGDGKSGVGKFLGNLISSVGPFLLGQYINYQAQKSVRQQYQSYQPSPGYSSGGSGSSGRPNSLSGRYAGGSSGGGYQQPYHSRDYAPAPNYYGNNYGYPYQYGGNLGGIVPALLTGAFGCSQGLGGAGLDLMSILSGGGGRFSANLGYGNGYSPEYNTPYQYGGIYGQPPGYNEERPYYRNYGGSQPGGNSGGGRSTGYLGGYNRDAYFYSKIGEARERIWATDVYGQNNNNSNYGFNGSFGSQYAPSYPLNYGGGYSANYGTPFSAGMDFNSLLQSMMLGGGLKANFNLQAYPGY